MKLHLHFQTGDLKVNEILEGDTAEAIVAGMQARVAKESGFLVGAIVKKMTPVQFAQEATRRYNAALKDNVALPQTCDDFVRMGIEKKFATVIEA